MKKIINGQIPYILWKDIKKITVTTYSELKPSNVIKEMELKTTRKELYTKVKKYCPELEYKDEPKDREYFFNVLNTLEPNCIDKMMRNARLNRIFSSGIDDKIEVIP